MEMIEVGQKVRFDPSYSWMGYGVEACRGRVTGEVVFVNEEHQWFLVQYGDMRTSFKLSQIGQEVRVCG